ncbi:DUF6124 family protein [Pseudomonas synxantha]|uniref:DUF3077 domain-containing protein n=1 Tax=Pseudomonas synxantha TaxID=47883 RepID=A0AAU8TV25_9PSED|nr:MULTISPECIES: DUF6124 family protein [Pseudomonas]AKA86205.1 hypothetical protein VO64_5659 [Pseudomonas synxantha]WDG44743.1 DUF6124 family protein [Pseudomonas synxantha]
MINDTTRQNSELHPEENEDLSHNRLFNVRDGLGTETLLVNASQDLASITDIATHLAFEIDGANRNVALGICRMLEGVQLLAGKVLDETHPVA